jgi:hypothetical protein
LYEEAKKVVFDRKKDFNKYWISESITRISDLYAFNHEFFAADGEQDVLDDYWFFIKDAMKDCNINVKG